MVIWLVYFLTAQRLPHTDGRMPQATEEKEGSEDGVDSALLHGCLQRQLDELEALELIYPPTSPSFPPSFPAICIEETSRVAVLSALSGDRKKSVQFLSSRDLPCLALTVGTCPRLGISLPASYPELRGSLPIIRWKEGGNLSTLAKNEAMQRFTSVSLSHDGGEHLLPLIQEMQSWLEELEKAGQETHKAASAQCVGGVADTLVVCRSLIYFHHIINKHKREFIIQEALAHSLGGYSKYGWPGVVVVEGEEQQVKAYTRLLQSLRWKEIRVRGEERELCTGDQGVDDMRRLHRGFEELDERGLSLLALRLREAGLGSLFATLMK